MAHAIFPEKSILFLFDVKKTDYTVLVWWLIPNKKAAISGAG